MAVLRNGVALAMLVVAAAFLASPVSAAEQVATPKCDWDCYLNLCHQKQTAKENNVGAMGVASTTAFPPKGNTITVDPSGKGNFKTIQQAIDSVPNGNTKRVTILIKNGTYKQKLKIISQKPYIYFKCESRKVIITWGDNAAKAGGTALSASTAVESLGFIASDCTFVNSAPAPNGGEVDKQAVALRIQGDQGAFYRCGFLGAQDTLYDKEGRHYFRSCEIVGSIDWIFGDGQSFYQYCLITSIAKANSGSITAQKRESNSKTGFVFFQCTIGGTGEIYLGRAWGTHSRVIFYECTINNKIRPEGWQDWDDKARQKTVFYAEYKCKGVGANRSKRVTWSRELKDAEAKPFSTIDFIDGNQWLGEKL